MLTLANFQIQEPIYESANSLVYRGIRTQDNQKVILKVLKEDYPSPQELARYQQEYEITKNFNLPGIIKTYGIEKYENTLVIVLEDFGGESLKKLINQEFPPSQESPSPSGRGSLNLLSFLSLAIQVADILGQIHAKNVIHKDINPANIVWNQTTNEIKIIDFGISSLLPRENLQLKNPNQLEGTLVYISPEQTGRMNRAVDYRTDLYSLGVAFYELLTGQLPFQSEVPLELVHAHLAKIPPTPIELNPEIPQVISDIIMKLMCKNAEDRYQSAFGLKWDLERCLENLRGFQNLEGFSLELAQHDFSGRFQIPQTLYGREKEIATLLQAFERVAVPPQSLPEGGKNPTGKGELMLVAGYSGVGKSALVHEVHKPMTEKQGYFAAGKFDQLERNIPYSAITQAFNAFCDYLLTESSEQLKQWREKILPAVGPNGQVLIEVIPHLELIIGSQPTVAPVGPSEAQNRFNLVFQNFFRAISQPEHPLILFIDDLQWADLASLNLLKNLLMDPENGHFLIIGAFRDNEVDKTHPFMLMVDEILEAQVIVNTISVSNLTNRDVNQLVADTLECGTTQSQTLTDLIYEKTHGNAFFTTEFLKSLYQEELLTFDTKERQWQWDVEKIAALSITDNVVELMADKIGLLPSGTIEVLKLAACIGNHFDLDMLAIIAQQNLSDTLALLWKGVEEGLVLPLDDHYKQPDKLQTGELQCRFKFQHDRVQQAAYSLIEETDKQTIHLKIGRLLLNSTPKAELDDHLFDIVNQLNAGRELIEELPEQQQLAELNLKAGQKAKSATAYVAAQQYIEVGTTLLTQESWQQLYPLTFALHKERAEMAYLNGHFENAEKWIDTTLQAAHSALEKVELYYLLVTQYIHLAKYPETIEFGKQALALLGIQLPDEKDLPVALEIEVAELKEKMALQDITLLLAQPEKNNPEAKITINLLWKLTESAYGIGSESLLGFIYAKVASLALKYGAVPESSLGYFSYGMLLSFSADYRTGYEFCLQGLELSKKFNNATYQCIICENLVGNIHFWIKPLKLADSIFQEGYQAGLNSGTFSQIGYLIVHQSLSLFYRGENLEPIIIKINDFLKFVQQNQLWFAVNILSGLKLILWNLSGKTQSKSIFQTDDLTEGQYLARCQEDLIVSCVFQLLKSQNAHLYGNPEKGFQHALEVEKLRDYVTGSFFVTVHNFYYSLNLAACYPAQTEQEQQQSWEQLETNQKQMKSWTENCPETFLHQYLLVEAELARISGNRLEAMDLYDRAINLAKKNEFVHIEALGNELAAQFWLANGKDHFAQVYLKAAHYNYQVWGAKRKVEDLEQKYPQWLKKIPTSVTRTHLTMTNTVKSRVSPTTVTYTPATIMATGSPLDLTTVMKASQAISSEIVLENLIKTFMQVVIENVGAEQGCLILNRKKQVEAESFQLFIAAYATLSQVEILDARPLESLSPDDEGGPCLSQAIVVYTARTQTLLVLNDASHDGQFTNDPYIVQTQPKSILCFPIIYKNQLEGVFYLENNLTTGAFTEDRVAVLTMLSTQIAISLENAQYANHLEEKVKERTAQLAEANEEITALNEMLKEENLRMGAELDVAKQLQQMVLPKEAELQQIEGLDIAGYMTPADEVGGDYYDVLVHEGRLKIGIGDVTGHGLESGVLMLMVQTAVRTLLDSGVNDASQFLTTLNHTIYNNVQRMGTDKNLTLSLIDYQPQIEIPPNPPLQKGGIPIEIPSNLPLQKGGVPQEVPPFEKEPQLVPPFEKGGVGGILRITGQHEEVLLVHKNGQIEHIDTFELGFSVGVVDDIADMVSQTNIELHPGEGIVLYTDGITEARDPDMGLYGLERLCEVVSTNWHLSAKQVQEAIVADVREYISTQKVYDDITVLVLKQK